MSGSGSRARIARTQIRAASAITIMIRTAKSAASTPSTVEFVTTVCMSSSDFAGAVTSPLSSAVWNLSRCAKKPSLGSPENTFW